MNVLAETDTQVGFLVTPAVCVLSDDDPRSGMSHGEKHLILMSDHQQVYDLTLFNHSGKDLKITIYSYGCLFSKVVPHGTDSMLALKLMYAGNKAYKNVKNEKLKGTTVLGFDDFDFSIIRLNFITEVSSKMSSELPVSFRFSKQHEALGGLCFPPVERKS